ncbi:hypothetical protein SAY87_015951 [Trapa incisa]|uniref:Biotin carboxyl carrier protein of acetyl-CoA carboxylase n=1 Tax=Trapa incisa TaxID=236973 RepID=A0AAN7LEF9_9MYRT|nr:hypothetical protein SAY87_015951 [Trapa incisa]
MSSSLSTTASTLPGVTARLGPVRCSSSRRIAFRPASHRPKLRFPAKGSCHAWNNYTVMKAQTKESGVAPSDPEDMKPSAATQATEESISEFISQVSNLVKLVDSKDIVELQLKQLDCEILIRKKEALPQPPAAPTPMMVHSPAPVLIPATPIVPPPSPTSAPPLASAPSASPATTKPAESSFPPLKCPMAGTFYRSPAPGEPAFVKKGDKVQKGQVVCIIEAMKLMNEIEADQSGTIVDILVEDGKPVSVDTPLFIIKP